MLYTSIHNDFDVRTRMNKISIPVCSRECGFLKIMSLRRKNRRPPPRMLFWSLRIVEQPSIDGVLSALQSLDSRMAIIPISQLINLSRSSSSFRADFISVPLYDCEFFRRLSSSLLRWNGVGGSRKLSDVD